MNIRPTTTDDIRNIEVASRFWGPENWKSAMTESPGAEARLAMLARSVEIDSHVVAIFGVAPSVPGVAEIWTLLEQGAYDHPIAMALAIKRVMPIPWTSLKLHRLQATIEKDTPMEEKTCELLEHHGFQKEGLLRQYFPGRDFFLYAKVTQ